MARNKVQFQKGLSEAQFAALYGTEDQCREAVMCWRWPSGFVCPVCGGKHHSVIKSRALYQCTACRRQTSLIAGTIFGATKVPLCTWFRAMYHLTQSKGGISSIELGRRLGVTQTTAWKIKHKLMQVMMERDAVKRLTGRIEVDDAYLGGERNGGKRGRGSPGKTPIVAAVETTPEGKPIRLKLRRVTGFRRAEITALAKRNFNSASTVVSDGLRCFPSADHHWIWPQGRPDPGVQVGQHYPRKHQKRHHWHLPCHPGQACTPLPRRIRISFQPTIRSRRYDATARLRRRPNSANAISPPQIS
jgi:transposase-like protein